MMRHEQVVKNLPLTTTEAIWQGGVMSLIMITSCDNDDDENPNEDCYELMVL
jgi:hypothetical protein